MIPHKHSWITARSLDVCRWCLRRRSPRDGYHPRIVLKERIDMSTGRNWTAIMGLGLILAVAMIAVLVIGLATQPTPKAAPKRPAVRWYYGQHTVAQTKQKGIVVDCVERTNSLKFGNREYAKPGDVYQFTCRARRAS